MILHVRQIELMTGIKRSIEKILLTTTVHLDWRRWRKVKRIFSWYMILLIRRHCYKAARWVDKIDNSCGVQERSDDANINADEKQYEERESIDWLYMKKKEKERSNHLFFFLLFYFNIRWIHNGNLLVYLTHRWEVFSPYSKTDLYAQWNQLDICLLLDNCQLF